MKGAFGRRHPATNFIFFAAVIIFSMLFNHPAFMTVSLLASLAYAVRLKGRSALKMFFFALLPLLLFVTFINSLFAHYGVTVLYTFKSGNNLTLESIVYGAVTGAIVVTMILWFMCYNEVVTEDKFMHLFGKRMPHIALLILMVLRFVPLYTKQFKEVVSARKGAGIAEDSGKLGKMKNAATAVSGVITWALEHSIETADSMKSRGYGLKGRTSYSRFTFSPSDAVVSALILIASAVMIVTKVFGVAEASYNPVIYLSDTTPEFIFSAMIYALLCFMPVIYDFAEEIKWNRLYAKG
ncbi:MAG: energy-coupling factor transporter transmembrane protein EcfT [Ruminococcaceae bacterium]|nr:energy-coupling factor transporter transmembrane protein EcfT [Oscillospiraceae bacterium]